MTPEFVINLGREALLTVLLVAAPVLGLGMAVGLLVSLFQATTQINEQTLAFIPKIVAVLGAIIIFGPWMLTKLLDFANAVFSALPGLVR
ncbi:MAG: flagellar biosynthesis protein FliQ [Bacillota bacterium]